MSDIPYIPFYPDAFLADTAMLTLEEKGAYFVVLCYMWINGAELPDDDLKLSRILGITPTKWKNLRLNLNHFFSYTENGFLTQKRLKKEWEKANNIRKKYSENGRKGGRPRKDNQGNLPGNEKAMGFSQQKPNESENPPETKAIGKPPPRPFQSHSQTKPAPNHSKRALASLSLGQAVDKALITHGISPELEELMADIDLLFIQLNLPFPTDAHLLSEWLHGGADGKKEVLPIIKTILERNIRRGVEAPKSFAYFIEAISEAVNKRQSGE